MGAKRNHVKANRIKCKPFEEFKTSAYFEVFFWRQITNHQPIVQNLDIKLNNSHNTGL
jgi:hypothetical protein